MRTKLQAVLLLSGAVLIAAPAHATLVISKGHTSNVNCSGGICNATAADAVLNNKDLTNMLATTDVKVFAEGIATEITVSAPVTWASSHTLTLGAYGSINVKDTITVEGTSGLTLTANVAQTGGVFRLVGTGKISFWDTKSALVINGTTYKLIDNLPDLIGAINTHFSDAYALSNDYNAAQDGSYPNSPISTPFSGIFEGLGNAITNLSIYNANASSAYVSLFKQVDDGGQLNDVVLNGISMQVGSAYLAPLAGTNNGTITHSYATGTLSGLGSLNFSMAGLVTENHGTITRSHTGVSMDGLAATAGGLVASNYGTISLSEASGAVKSQSMAGGLAGFCTGTITQSSATGDVSVVPGVAAVAGGLVGQFYGTITQSFATGNVSGGTGEAKAQQRFKRAGLELGGLAGYSAGTIQYAYARGAVTAVAALQGAKHAQVGGLVGATSSNPGFSHITQAYSLGHVSLNDSKYIGGSIGVDLAQQGSNDLVFWDLDTSGITNPNQGAGNMFDDHGLKGVADGSIRKAMKRQFDSAIWAESGNINDGYPYLIANPPQ